MNNDPTINGVGASKNWFQDTSSRTAKTIRNSAGRVVKIGTRENQENTEVSKTQTTWINAQPTARFSDNSSSSFASDETTAPKHRFSKLPKLNLKKLFGFFSFSKAKDANVVISGPSLTTKEIKLKLGKLNVAQLSREEVTSLSEMESKIDDKLSGKRKNILNTLAEFNKEFPDVSEDRIDHMIENHSRFLFGFFDDLSIDQKNRLIEKALSTKPGVQYLAEHRAKDLFEYLDSSSKAVNETIINDVLLKLNNKQCVELIKKAYDQKIEDSLNEGDLLRGTSAASILNAKFQQKLGVSVNQNTLEFFRNTPVDYILPSALEDTNPLFDDNADDRVKEDAQKAIDESLSHLQTFLTGLPIEIKQVAQHVAFAANEKFPDTGTKHGMNIAILRGFGGELMENVVLQQAKKIREIEDQVEAAYLSKNPTQNVDERRVGVTKARNSVAPELKAQRSNANGLIRIIQTLANQTPDGGVTKNHPFTVNLILENQGKFNELADNFLAGNL